MNILSFYLVNIALTTFRMRHTMPDMNLFVEEEVSRYEYYTKE